MNICLFFCILWMWVFHFFADVLSAHITGLCRRTTVHVVLCHQAADGKGTHRRHHWRGALLPQWRQTHPPTNRIQNPGRWQFAKWFTNKPCLNSEDCWFESWPCQDCGVCWASTKLPHFLEFITDVSVTGAGLQRGDVKMIVYIFYFYIKKIV